MRLLYIEDDASFAKLLHSELLAYRSVLWDLVHVVTLDEALERITEETFDAILADLSLPDSAGLATCERLCDAVPDVPLVVLSHTADLNVAVQAVNMGAQEYLYKGSLIGPQVMRRVRFAIERRKTETRQHHVDAIGQDNAVAEQIDVQNDQLRRTAEIPQAAQGDAPYGSAQASGPNPLESDGPIRLLHIEDDDSFVRLIRHHLQSGSSVRFEVENFSSLQTALERLQQHDFAAVLLDMSLPDGEGLDSLHAILPHIGRTPVLMLTGHDDESTAVQSIQRGAQDFIVKTELDAVVLERAILLSITRATRAIAPPRQWDQGKQEKSFGHLPKSDLDDDRRRNHRYLLTKPMSVIPVRSNNLPDVERSGEALALDLSVGGLAFQISEPHRLPSRRWVVGIEADDGQPYFTTVEVRNTHSVPGGMRIGARFTEGDQDVLSKSNLNPTFNMETGRLTPGLPADVLDKWAELGIVRPVLLDRVFVCPECRALATFGNGCRACGSAHLASCQLIHHFACAYVGYVSEFEHGNEVVCPKCRLRGLIIGADFEFLNGPYRCLRCGFSDTELEKVGCCLRCDWRFPMHQAVEEELIGYHVNRLDPSALLDSP